MSSRPFKHLAALLIAAFPAVGLAAGDQAFEARFEKLLSSRDAVEVVVAPKKKPAGPIPASRSLVPPPPTVLEAADVVAAVAEHEDELRSCYRKQAKGSFGDKLILDLAIRKTGAVAELRLAPAEAASHPVGRCILRHAARWRFPAFTGELKGDVSEEVVNRSVPVRFVQAKGASK